MLYTSCGVYPCYSFSPAAHQSGTYPIRNSATLVQVRSNPRITITVDRGKTIRRT